MRQAIVHAASAADRRARQPRGLQRLPRDGNSAACDALYDDVARELRYFRVPYDHGAAARKVIAAGLPIVFAMRLIEGI